MKYKIRDGIIIIVDFDIISADDVCTEESNDETAALNEIKW